MASSLRDACEVTVDLGLGTPTPTRYYSLPALEKHGKVAVSRLPVCLRIILESLLRNCDGGKIAEDQVWELAHWKPAGARTTEIPFMVGRVVLNDTAGIPLLGDLTALRAAVRKQGGAASLVEPQVPVDQVIDHTLTVDYYGTPDALARNVQLEVERNKERFHFVKWATQAYRGIRLIPSGFGILHQINLEFLAPGMLIKDGVCYPDTLVGSDSHTCMIAGLGVVGWGVGGIEGVSAMLGQPVNLLMPDVTGVRVTGKLRPGVTTTDMVLYVTEMLRNAKVVGQFLEFFGDGVAQLTVPDRATISNMAPEYGATIGYFPVDEQTCRYLRDTGRPEILVQAVEAYFRLQGCFGGPRLRDVKYTRVLKLDLSAIVPCVAGPKRPQDRVPLSRLKSRFNNLLVKPLAEGGYGKSEVVIPSAEQPAGTGQALGDGSVVIAAITSCTNTSNPSVMLAAGLVAKNAVAKGLKTKSWVKTSLTPGSIVVSKYLKATGLQDALDALGFAVAGYSCGTCVGSSGPLATEIEKAIVDRNLVACAVLSGNRNFEARIHPAVRANFLCSPPLVVAFALAGRVDIDFSREPLGPDAQGAAVYLEDIWPGPEELANMLNAAADRDNYDTVYGMELAQGNSLWNDIALAKGEIYPWDPASTYIKEPPFLSNPALTQSSLHELKDARALAILGNSVTTDHISPISVIKTTSPAGLYLQSLGVAPADFNNYGARRMNSDVMVRGAFAHVRLRNAMAPGVEGGVTVHQPSGEQMTIYDAAMRYAQERVPLLIIAGEEYGTGSARDWAAKGTRLLGVRAVIASSFEHIHRSNLVGMGVLPCQFSAGTNATTLQLNGSERYELVGLDDNAQPGQALTLKIHRKDGSSQEVDLKLRVDTRPEIEYLKRGGILPYVLNELMHTDKEGIVSNEL